jgi:hypothetical protein
MATNHCRSLVATPDWRVAEAVTGVKAADREKQKAAAIGTAVHAGIEWENLSTSR